MKRFILVHFVLKWASEWLWLAYVASDWSVVQVDTVNDAHMVASGVPEKNGDKHAPEIATMALDLLVGKDIYRLFILYMIWSGHLCSDGNTAQAQWEGAAESQCPLWLCSGGNPGSERKHTFKLQHEL